MANTGLTGAAGELLVAAELLRRGVAVARPLYDDGIDLLAFDTKNPTRTVPIQVKARSGAGYNFQKDWFCVRELVLVLVWHTATRPEFYILRREDVEDALGPIHSASPSWCERGGYSVTEPGPEIIQRMQQHRDRWERVAGALRNGECGLESGSIPTIKQTRPEDDMAIRYTIQEGGAAMGAAEARDVAEHVVRSGASYTVQGTTAEQAEGTRRVEAEIQKLRAASAGTS